MEHLETMERPFIIEIIDERFDNVSTMLTDNAVVYGSSITSIISGIEAKGDLDIAVSHIEFMNLCRRFANSSKWEQITGEKIRETDFSLRKNSFAPAFRSSTSGSSLSWKKQNVGSNNTYKNVSKIVAFKNIEDKCVQIIQASEKTNNALHDALSVVRAVDFVFCGIAIDKHGKIFEVIKSALEDCNNKIIRVKNYHSKLKERFNKYIKRGWNLGISIDQAQSNYLKERKKENKTSNNKYVKVEFDNKAGIFRFIFSNIMRKRMGMKSLNNLIVSTAKGMYGIPLKSVGKEGNIVYVEDGSKKKPDLSEGLANIISSDIVCTFKTKYAPKKKKKFSTGGNYSIPEGKAYIEKSANYNKYTVHPPKTKMTKSNLDTLRGKMIIKTIGPCDELIGHESLTTIKHAKKNTKLGTYSVDEPISYWSKHHAAVDEVAASIEPTRKKATFGSVIDEVETRYAAWRTEDKKEILNRAYSGLGVKENKEVNKIISKWDKKIMKKGEPTNE